MTEYWQAKKPPRKVNTWPQLIVAGVLLALWCGWRSLSQPGEAARFGAALDSGNLDLFLAEWLGRSLLPVTLAVLVVGAVVSILIWRTAKQNHQLRILLVLLIAGWLGAASPFLLFGLGAAASLGDPITSAERAMSADVRASLAQNGPALSLKPRSGGEAGQIEGVLRQLIANRIADARELDEALGEIGYPGFMEPAALAAPGALAQARPKLVAMKLLFEKFRARQDQRLYDTYKALEALSLSPDLEERLLNDYNGAVERARADRTRYWDLQYAAAFELQQEVEVLRRGHWRRGGDRFAFTSQADLDAFNEHADKLAGMRTEIDVISGRAFQSPMGGFRPASEPRIYDPERD